MLLDTNVISEMWRRLPDVNVTAWLDVHSGGELYVCAPSLAEIRAGIDRLPDGERKRCLESAARALIADFYPDRFLNFDLAAAMTFGRISAARERIGRRIEMLDGMIAAIALCHEMPLVTRNTQDFVEIGLALINPFEAAPRNLGS